MEPVTVTASVAQTSLNVIVATSSAVEHVGWVERFITWLTSLI